MGASSKNPNTKSRRSQSVRATKQRRVQMKKAYEQRLATKHQISKAAARKGAKPGLLPTSGKGAAVSRKKAKKLERQMGYALRRKMAAEGEVEMKDAQQPKTTEKTDEENMEVDMTNIS